MRCLVLTCLSREHVAHALTQLVRPFASVSPEDRWMPDGFLRPDEAKLGETLGFLSPAMREQLTEWWLKVRRRANTPNWDIVSTCTIEGKQGLVLVEAKAHDRELRADGKKKTAKTNEDNHERIGSAIQAANDGLNVILPGWALSRDSHYQLSNRFAWAWKLAEMDIPVVLVYLGFLNATEMEDRGEPFPNHQEWRNYMMDEVIGIVPPEAWERPLLVGRAHLVTLLRSADFSVTISV